jgi:hypothetical protein
MVEWRAKAFQLAGLRFGTADSSAEPTTKACAMVHTTRTLPFIAAIDRRSRYDGRPDNVTWLCGIARHKLAREFELLNPKLAQDRPLPYGINPLTVRFAVRGAR